jgi:hypothetical protein
MQVGHGEGSMPQPPDARPDPDRSSADLRPSRRTREARDALVDLASELSFPASDPPAFWAGIMEDDNEDATGDA